MSKELTPYFFAIGATFTFSLATLGFSHFTRRVSAYWMNAFKALIAFVSFTILFAFTNSGQLPSHESLISFLTSGLIGLCVADWFLMYAFGALGPARTLMLFGFQPIILGTFGYLLFAQEVEVERLIAIVFLIGSLTTLSMESFKKTGHWGVRGLVIGFIAISVDAAGVILTKWGFTHSPWISASEGNFYRCVGAAVGFVIMCLFKPTHLWKQLIKFNSRERILVISASFAGTFLSLFLWLNAVQTGHLASISGITITGPLFAGLLESAIHKKAPSKYLIGGFLLFAIGFSILVF